ncbi:hypothetical protein H6F67_17815 [Microcoleus sp. FACHB-1515]|uniref:hypothetical protein n=1 Tax=Cyanophyceae TaxID=3028117 RepID=UPI001687DC51|nr:hypothetical protein [Microcoleus sp. FACHB-1515]MBD2091704.1 hypothetical protein [Microcoleus sp. FACHB-1515]
MAASTAMQVVPNQMMENGLEFNVERRIDRNLDQSEFTIDVVTKDSSFPEVGYTFLSTFEVKPNGFSSYGHRDVNCITEAARMHCAFTVSDQELQNQNLSFLLSIPTRLDPNGNVVPSISLLYFRLNDPQIRIVNEPIDSTNFLTPLWNLISSLENQIRQIF